jgi:Subtilase family
MRIAFAPTIIALILSAGADAADPARQKDASETASYRIEVLGKDPAADWAKAILPIADFVPTKTLKLAKGQGSCAAVLEQLKFTQNHLGCADEMKAVIKRFNPNLPSPEPDGLEIRYPDLPISEVRWRVGFDTSTTEEKNRYEKVKSIWKQFKIDEKSAGQFLTLQLKGISSLLTIEKTPEAKEALEKLERFNPDLNRYETRAVTMDPEPGPKRRYASALTPIDWAESCGFGMPPAPPAPPYISLMNKSTNAACVRECARSSTCPQIVLIDQAVASHPDLTDALGSRPNQAAGLASAGTTEKPSWCPFDRFDRNKNHGTHLAGIMVSSGASGGFEGLAPNASLDSEDIPDNQIKDQVLDVKVNQKQLPIYVYAGRFKVDGVLHTRIERLHKPRLVEDILQSRGLWVVAAGEPTEADEQVQDIGQFTPASPMNLGDRPNIMVVTACQNCYSEQPSVPSWANYSSQGVISLSAPGGIDGREIPSTISAAKLGLAHGTSQSTAMVAGLAAAMVSCFPQRYVNGILLKERLEGTAKPVPAEMASKLSVGIVDAARAMRDPDLHWIRLSGGDLTSMKDVRFCTDYLKLKDADSGAPLRPIPVKTLRQIVRKRIPGADDAWQVQYETKAPDGVRNREWTAPARLLGDDDGTNAMPKPPKPLLFFSDGRTALERQPVPLVQIEDLIFSLNSGLIPLNYKGCFG